MEKLIRRVVGLQYLENDPETPIFADFQRCTTDGSIFHCALLETNIIITVANPIPNVVLNPQFVGTADSAGFQVRSPDSFLTIFAIFSVTQIVTEYDGHPIPTVADYSRLGSTADSADFQGPIARTRF